MIETEADRLERRRWICSAIRNCEEQIEGWSREITKLREKIEEQSRMEREYTVMQSEVEDSKNRKWNKISNMEGYEEKVKFFGGYKVRMQDFLDGQRAERSGEYMRDATCRMREEIGTNQRKLEELERKIARGSEQIRSLESELRWI